MNAFQEVVRWAIRLPPWQSDAVRRLFSQNHLSAQDTEEILLMLKEAHGIKSEATPVPTPRPALETDFPLTPNAAWTTVLKAMRNLKNVNALIPNQILKFADEGLTVIYGDNATGKSGYSRVLKRACRARGEERPILPNLYADRVPPEPAGCTFDISAGGRDASVEWRAGQPSPDCLAEIAVFDSLCARVYVDEANEVFYLPYGLDIFEKLASLCSSLRIRIQRELPQIEPLPAGFLRAIEGTRVGVVAGALDHNTHVEGLKQLGHLSSSDESRRQELETRIAQFKATGPEAKAADLRRRKARGDRVLTAVALIEERVSDQKARELRDSCLAARSAAEAARLASDRDFAKEPLPGVGSGPWRDMFEAARKYSEQAGYTGLPFPVMQEGSRCVLCQQVLNEEAAQRLRRFDDFVRHNIQQIATQKRTCFEAALKSISEIDLRPESVDAETLAEIREDDPEAARMVAEFLESARLRVQAITTACGTGQWSALPPLGSSPTDPISTLLHRLESTAAEFDALIRPAEMAKLETEFKELSAKRQLAANEDIVRKQISRLQLRHRLEECIGATDTTKITITGRNLMDKAVTKALRSALNREFQALGLDHLKLRIIESGRKGALFHKLALDARRFPNATLSEVLSEGEQQIIALASFLAELDASPHRFGIVFDDPVCSLDHLWRERVAARLVEEAKKRQVVIFTHDIVFLVDVQNAADRAGVKTLAQTVVRGAGGVGRCLSEGALPWCAMTVRERISCLRKLLQEAEKTFTKGGALDEYRGQAGEFYDRLRASWERAVEEVVFGDVVQRFRNSVKTQQLRCVTFLDADYENIEAGMTKCSRCIPAHDDARARNAPPPPPDELKRDLEALNAFVKNLREKQAETQKRRRR